MPLPSYSVVGLYYITITTLEILFRFSSTPYRNVRKNYPARESCVWPSSKLDPETSSNSTYPTRLIAIEPRAPPPELQQVYQYYFTQVCVGTHLHLSPLPHGSLNYRTSARECAPQVSLPYLLPLDCVALPSTYSDCRFRRLVKHPINSCRHWAFVASGYTW